MLMNHYGYYDENLTNDSLLAEQTGTSADNGASAQDLAAYMQAIGWNTEVSTWQNMPFDFRKNHGSHQSVC